MCEGDILIITLCAVICGAGDWVAIARFGRAKRKWFRGDHGRIEVRRARATDASASG